MKNYFYFSLKKFVFWIIEKSRFYYKDLDFTVSGNSRWWKE